MLIANFDVSFKFKKSYLFTKNYYIVQITKNILLTFLVFLYYINHCLLNQMVFNWYLNYLDSHASRDIGNLF